MIKFLNDTDDNIFFFNSSFPLCISNDDVLSYRCTIFLTLFLF